MRTVIGFILAPLLPVIIVGGLDHSAGLVIALFGYAATLILGVPAHLILQKMMWVGWLNYIVAGVLIGIVGGILASIVLVASNHAPPDSKVISYVVDALTSPIREPLPFLFLGVLGAVGGVAFWLVARPDHSLSA
jgi:hypothetical protein